MHPRGGGQKSSSTTLMVTGNDESNGVHRLRNASESSGNDVEGGLVQAKSDHHLLPAGGDKSAALLGVSPRQGRKTSVAYAFSVFAFYIAAGPSVIFLNSYLLNEVHFPYAATLSLLGVSMSCVVAWTLIAVGVVPSKQIEQVTPKFYAMKVAPIGLSLAFTLACGNAVYLYLSVAFIQILKAFSPVILVGLLFVTRLEKPRSLLTLSIAVIVSGVVAATTGELHATPRGILMMLASESFEAVKVVNMQLLLTAHKYDAWESLAVFGPSAVIGLLGVAFLTEDLGAAYDIVLARPILFLAASLGGLAVNLATSLYIKATSALTLRVTSLGRNVGIVLVSAALFPNSSITGLEFLGYVLSLVGCLIYQHARSHADETVSSLWAKIISKHRYLCLGYNVFGGGGADLGGKGASGSAVVPSSSASSSSAAGGGAAASPVCMTGAVAKSADASVAGGGPKQ